MAFIQKEIRFSKSWFVNYSLISFGALFLAMGFVFFITPYKIVPGGIYGIAIVIHYLTKGLLPFLPNGFPIGLVGLIINIPLIFIAIRLLGPRFGMKTIVGIVLSSLFIDLLTLYWGEKPLVPDDAMLSAVFGGILIGFGLGLIFKSKATTGGTDIIAMIASKYTRIPLGHLLIIVDTIIVVFGLAVFQDWRIPLYSIIAIFVTGRVIDTTMQGAKYDKALFIISDKNEQIKSKIIHDLNRSGTIIKGTGMYEGKERNIIFTNVNRRELVILQDFIKDIDPKAFMSVIDASEIIGSGFKMIHEI
jgi:uncharacterized membrane-anchored protein YitT (DUF2179 family)